MYCPSCGKLVPDINLYCPHCGTKLSKTVLVAKTMSGLAIASLVLGILGFLVLPIIGPILAAIFGERAKRKIESSPNIGGKGMAIAGMILGIIGITVTILVALTLIIRQARPRRVAPPIMPPAPTAPLPPSSF